MTIAENQKTPTTTATSPPETNHVLMVTLSAQGHMNPLLRFGKRLHSKGLHVTLAAPEIARHRVLSHSSSVAKSLEIAGVGMEFFSDGISLEGDRTDLDEYFETINRFGPENLSKLIRDIQTQAPKISCIISSPFVPWVADVAVELGIPCAMLWIQPCSLFSIYYRFYNNLQPFTSPLGEEIVAVDVPGLPSLHTVDLPSFILPSYINGSIAKVLRQCFQSVHKHNWVLANSFDELETDPTRSISAHISIKSVGPLVSRSLFDEGEAEEAELDMWKADESCMEWLNEQAPGSVIYVSFGSLLSLPGETMESIGTALKKTKMPFLWVVKSSEVKPEEGPKSVAYGGENGRVVTWSPQSRVLKHPSIGCFLTHCGWNSILEALTAGVPLICYPQWTDQPTNAKLVEEAFGVGVRLWPNKEGGVSAEEVERCIGSVMVGPAADKFRARAANWKRVAREAVTHGGSSDRNIKWFVDEIVKLSAS